MLIGVDASQLEWRTLLELSRDPVGIAEVLNGDDTHSLNQIAFELPSRLIAKIYLFRTIFRGSGWSFANDPDFMHVSSDPKYWDSVNEKFFKKYAGIDQCHTAWSKLVINNQPLINPFGREWLIEMKRDRFGELKLPLTTLTNYPVQGTGADVMMVARVSFARRLRNIVTNGRCLMISTVHDSIVLDVEDERDYQVLINLFHQVFDDLPINFKKLFGYNWIVPLPCETKLGLNMKSMTKIGRTDG